MLPTAPFRRTSSVKGNRPKKHALRQRNNSLRLLLLLSPPLSVCTTISNLRSWGGLWRGARQKTETKQYTFVVAAVAALIVVAAVVVVLPNKDLLPPLALDTFSSTTIKFILGSETKTVSGRRGRV